MSEKSNKISYTGVGLLVLVVIVAVLFWVLNKFTVSEGGSVPQSQQQAIAEEDVEDELIEEVEGESTQEMELFDELYESSSDMPL